MNRALNHVYGMLKPLTYDTPLAGDSLDAAQSETTHLWDQLPGRPTRTCVTTQGTDTWHGLADPANGDQAMTADLAGPADGLPPSASMTTSGAASRAAARDSVHGLALGDAFGQRWLPPTRTPEQALAQIRDRRTPEEPDWPWTDDTALALAILRALHADGEIHPDHLAAHFAAAYQAEPGRGYGHGMRQLLPHLAHTPASWRTEAARLFGGEGSLGNGAAMRIAPLGAWFHDDLHQAIAQATLAARVTHAHAEGIAGAVAVAVAAALAASLTGLPSPAPDLLHQVAEHTPAGAVRDGLLRAAALPDDLPPGQAAAALGSGQRVRADDTVPFALWSAAHHLDNLADALWTTAEGLGDVDTTCAITAGIVAAHASLTTAPADWLSHREPLPGWVHAP